jgi:hypothetical protein
MKKTVDGDNILEQAVTAMHDMKSRIGELNKLAASLPDIKDGNGEIVTTINKLGDKTLDLSAQLSTIKSNNETIQNNVLVVNKNLKVYISQIQAEVNSLTTKQEALESRFNEVSTLINQQGIAYRSRDTINLIISALMLILFTYVAFSHRSRFNSIDEQLKTIITQTSKDDGSSKESDSPAQKSKATDKKSSKAKQ